MLNIYEERQTMYKYRIKLNHLVIILSSLISACASDPLPSVTLMAQTSAPMPIINSTPVIEPQLVFNTFGFTSTLYIDNQIAYDCTDYSPAIRRCGAGNEVAFHNINSSKKSAAAGVLFYIRGGQYKEALHVTRSGLVNAYLGYSAYGNETVTLLAANTLDRGEEYGAIWLDEVSYVLINAINVRDSIGFGRLLNAHYNVISNSQFSQSTLWNEGRGKSKRGGLYIAFSHYNRIINNHFYKGTDSLSLIHANHNLIAGNYMDLAGHDIWNIKCGSFNVIRNNEFSNKNQKIGALFDCESGTMSWHGNGKFAQSEAVVDSTQYNLIEHNIFKDAVHYYSASGGNGIQYAAQHGIIRNNLFYRVNVGLGMTAYGQEAQYNYANRVYNNTFNNNWCAGISISRPLNKMTDNEYRNNILWNNQGFGTAHCQENNSKQILLINRKNKGERFINNNIASTTDKYVLGIWGRSLSDSIFAYSLRDGAVNFTDNIAIDPGFKDELINDYRLQSTSKMIDVGSFLSSVISKSGSGNLLQLADVTYFYDGFAIPGEVGDSVRIEGTTETAVIVKIDYIQQSIILDKALTWQQGDGIALSYNGTHPDIGALEY